MDKFGYSLGSKISKNIVDKINIFDKDPDKINREINPLLILKNVGKYILVRNDSGEAQSNVYTAYEIINEDTQTKGFPLITMKELGVIDTDNYRTGGQTNTKYRSSRHRKYRNKYRNKSKKNRTKKYYK